MNASMEVQAWANYEEDLDFYAGMGGYDDGDGDGQADPEAEARAAAAAEAYRARKVADCQAAEAAARRDAALPREYSGGRTKLFKS